MLDAYAEQQARPTATVAAGLLGTELRRVTSGAGDELAEAARQLEQMRTANVALRRRLADAGLDAVAEVPRWERPMAELLADREWWTAWLPRLHQLLGRQPHQYGRNRVDTVDAGGYPDLMAFVFPPVRDPTGRVLAEWHSPHYADHSAREPVIGGHSAGPTGAGQARAAVWEPVVRHVAVALCALEITALPGADPLLRIRAEDEIAGAWLRTLRRLTGSEVPALPASPE
jgi:hypothetical protein